MADFPGMLVESTNVYAATFPGRVAKAYQAAPIFSGELADTIPDVPDPYGPKTGSGVKSSFASTDYDGATQDKLAMGEDWFEDFHILPRSIALGNVLSTQEVDIEVYSAFRETFHPWNSYVNNAGAGVTLVGQPPLPYSFAPQSGLQMVLSVSPSGPAKVDTTLDFGFDIGTIYIPISLERVVLFAVTPEAPYTELLEFLTDIIEHKDGSEQRISARRYPRQMFQWELVLDQNSQLTRLNNILFDWQPRIFGLPMWHEHTSMTTAATAGVFTINVGSTANADYRIGKLVAVYSSETVFDVLELDSLTSTSLTFVSPLLNNYSVGALVVPLRTAYLDRTVSGEQYPVGASAKRLVFIVEDNEVSLADTSAFATFNGKVLLSDINGVRGTMAEEMTRQLSIMDGGTGKVVQDSTWDRSKRGSRKTFLTNSQAGLWNVRRLMHAIRGRQVSFYIPTFSKDLIPTATLASGSNQLQIEHVGYTQFVRNRSPRNVIQILLNDGTSLLRTITASSVMDPNNEALTMNTTWASSITAAQIARISFVENSRFASDAIRFDYNVGGRVTKISAPVMAVFE